MALTPFDMEGVNRDLLAAGNPAKPDMQSILRRNARDLVLGNAILVSSADAKELEFGVHMAYSDADGGFDTDPSEDVWFEASSLPIPNERPDLPPDNALRIRVTDVLTEYGFTDIDVKAPDRTPEGIWIGFEAMQPVRLDVTSAQGGRSVSFTLTAAEANDWRSGRLDAHGLSRMAVERVLARPGDTVTLAYGDSLFRPAVMCDGSGRLPEHRVKAGIGTFVIGRESEAVMPEILRIDRTVDPRDPLVIEKAFGKENDMENGNVPEYWKGLMDEADLPLAGIVREHGGGLMDFHRMKGIERLTGSSDWDFYSWTVENYDDDLLDVCERENAADVLADLQAWWKTSQPDMRQHVDEMMAGIDAAMEPLDKRLYAAADKLLSYACASHLRRRDLWDMCWLASRGDVDSRRAMELAELKSSDYGEEGLWADRADRVAGVADVIGSDAFADEMRRFLPAGLMTSTVESPRWSAWAIEQIGTLYGTPGTPSSADAVPGFPIFGASNDSSPTR